ncbi:MAG: response regulator [Polaromonas sp.]|nr:response regulator [Polaromonas sp.]
MTETTPNFEPEPELQLTQANRAMQQQLMELKAVAQIVLQIESQQLTLNARAYELFGFDPAGPKVSLEQAETLVHPEDLAIFFRAGERSRDLQGAVELDYRVIRPDGHLLHLHARRYTERDGQGRAITSVLLALDATERKRAESALLETAERVRALTALAPDEPLEPEPAPAAAAKTPSLAASATATLEKIPAVPHRKMRVLYVEDNMFNLMLFDEVMQTREDVELRIAKDGAKGLDIARTWLPDILVLDAHLPDTHGIELLQLMRSIPELQNKPAFMCSGDSQPEQKKAARDAGFEGYWTKPVDIDKLFVDLDRISTHTVFS